MENTPIRSPWKNELLIYSGTEGGDHVSEVEKHDGKGAFKNIYGLV